MKRLALSLVFLLSVAQLATAQTQSCGNLFNISHGVPQYKSNTCGTPRKITWGGISWARTQVAGNVTAQIRPRLERYDPFTQWIEHPMTGEVIPSTVHAFTPLTYGMWASTNGPMTFSDIAAPANAGGQRYRITWEYRQLNGSQWSQVSKLCSSDTWQLNCYTNGDPGDYENIGFPPFN